MVASSFRHALIRFPPIAGSLKKETQEEIAIAPTKQPLIVRNLKIRVLSDDCAVMICKLGPSSRQMCSVKRVSLCKFRDEAVFRDCASG